MHVGLLYTPADVEKKRDRSIDPHGSEQMDLTVKAIEKALMDNGHEVTRIPATLDLLKDIKAIEGMEIIFNACTGITNKMQQANVVGMLELMEVPFVGSSLSTHILGLHKHISKRLFQSVGVPTANFQVFYTGKEPVDPSLKYPLIIKPEHEGSSLGITEDSVVHDEESLRKGLQKIFANTGWVLSERIVQLGIGLLVNILVARYLGPEKYGILSYALSLIAFLGTFVYLGLSGLVVRDIVRFPDAKDVILGTTFSLKFAGSIFAFLVVIDCW